MKNKTTTGHLTPLPRDRSVAIWQPNTSKDEKTYDLTADEKARFKPAGEAARALRKTLDHWIVIGHAVVAAREAADRIGGRKTFMRIIEQEGLANVVDKVTASRLLRIMHDLEAVQAWRESLTESQRIDWSSPSAVLKHCTALMSRPRDEAAKPKKLSAYAKLQEANVTLNEQVHRLAMELKGRKVAEEFIAAVRKTPEAAMRDFIADYLPAKRDEKGIVNDLAERRRIADFFAAMIYHAGIKVSDVSDRDNEDAKHISVNLIFGAHPLKPRTVRWQSLA